MLSVPSPEGWDAGVARCLRSLFPGMCPGPPPPWCKFPTCQIRNLQLRPRARKGSRSHQLWEPVFWHGEQKGAGPGQCRTEGGKLGRWAKAAREEASKQSTWQTVAGGEGRASSQKRGGSCPSLDPVPHQVFLTPQSPPPLPSCKVTAGRTGSELCPRLFTCFNKREPLSIVFKKN